MSTLADWANRYIDDPEALDEAAQDRGYTRWLDSWQGTTVLLHDRATGEWAVQNSGGLWVPKRWKGPAQ